MTSNCKSEVRRQIQMEVDASVAYLALGAHFAQVKINRNGFSDFFFKAAGEEREHAGKLISYLLMRGELTENVTSLITITVSASESFLLLLVANNVCNLIVRNLLNILQESNKLCLSNRINL